MNIEKSKENGKSKSPIPVAPKTRELPIVTVHATLEGLTPLLQHRFGEAAEGDSGKSTRRVEVHRGTPREEAEKVCYRHPDGHLYLPGPAIGRLLREAGGGHKQRGSRKSLKYIVPAAVIVMDDAITLHDAAGKPIKAFEVDSRPVVIPATKGRVMRHRARLDTWQVTVHLRINENVLATETIHQLLVEGGSMIGLGDYRPEKGGPFGTFRLLHWKT
ncbi:MAG: hypothetical protein A2Y38_17105 [Spirochaetes bacterium GWB1_59_5]|nr:MAG: hypothetical protein A2Y38_17105 [Spirochaetes bacterium GWB1_59_5]